MPVVVKAFDLALGLRGGRVAQGDFVETERPAELGESVGLAGEKEGMVIDIEGEREAAGEKGGGQIVEVSEQSFGGIEARERQQAAVIIESLEQMKTRGLIGEPAMRRSVVLPKLADLLGLPAAHGLLRFFVAGVRRELMGESPAADRGAVELEAVAAMHLRSGKAVESGRA